MDDSTKSRVNLLANMSEPKSSPQYFQEVDNVNHVDESLSENSKEAPDYDPEYTPEQQSKIIHRIDRRLIGTCGVLYCISLMDRTNLSAAALAGMTAELRLNVGFRYVGTPSCGLRYILTHLRAL